MLTAVIKIIKIVFATEQPILVRGFREVLRRAGLGMEPVMVRPDNLFESIAGGEPCLVFIDGQRALSRVDLSGLRMCAPKSRFVVCSSTITPEMLEAAVRAGIHGVLSTHLPVDEAAQSVVQICAGESVLRFHSGSAPPAKEMPPPSPEETFDALWMLGS